MNKFNQKCLTMNGILFEVNSVWNLIIINFRQWHNKKITSMHWFIFNFISQFQLIFNFDRYLGNHFSFSFSFSNTLALTIVWMALLYAIIYIDYCTHTGSVSKPSTVYVHYKIAKLIKYLKWQQNKRIDVLNCILNLYNLFSVLMMQYMPRFLYNLLRFSLSSTFFFSVI